MVKKLAKGSEKIKTPIPSEKTMLDKIFKSIEDIRKH